MYCTIAPMETADRVFAPLTFGLERNKRMWTICLRKRGTAAETIVEKSTVKLA